ncbi:MAG TPA: hypothetical protein VK968_07965, partial [Roseimicrobium sp.]|nr:hypothetical protein [Roseimicrobium sp.]
MPIYKIFGVVMRCDVPVPGIVPLDDGSDPSDVGVEIRLGADLSSWPIAAGQTGGVEVYESSVSGVFGGPNVRVDHFPMQGIYRYLYDDGIVFLISGRG